MPEHPERDHEVADSDDQGYRDSAEQRAYERAGGEDERQAPDRGPDGDGDVPDGQAEPEGAEPDSAG